MKKRMKQILALVLACILCVGLFSVNTFAAVYGFSGFKISQVTVTPVVDAGGYRKNLTQYTQTKNYTGDKRSLLVYWDSYKVNGFNKYVVDNDYKMLGWEISVTGKHTVGYENSTLEEKLVSFECLIDDTSVLTKDISYSKNRNETFERIATLPEELTDYNSISSKLTCKTTYRRANSSTNSVSEDRVSLDMSYWPKYGI